MTNAQKQQITELRMQGVGYVKIGKILGISNNTVRSFCRRNNLDGQVDEGIVRCKNCGKTIRNKAGQKPKKFCSDICRTNWWNSHQECVKRKAIYTYSCTHCGKTFTAYGNKGRKYCSHKCYIDDRFRRESDCDE